jgi:hypothetical protein
MRLWSKQIPGSMPPSLLCFRIGAFLVAPLVEEEDVAAAAAARK